MSAAVDAHQRNSRVRNRLESGLKPRRLRHLSEIDRIRSKLGWLYTDKEDPAALDPFGEVEYLPKRRLRVLREAFKEGI